MRLGMWTAALAMVMAIGSTADAAPVSKCNAAKKKCIGKYIAAALGCHAKAESKGEAVSTDCLNKATAKITGGGKGCFDKNDAKVPNDCAQTGNATQQLTDADDLVAAVVSAVDPDYPTPTLTKCGAARKKCVGKKAAGLMGCEAKANKTGTPDPTCAPKIMAKFGGGKGCDVNALAKGIDCLGSATTSELETLVDDWEALAAFGLDYSGPPCGNGFIDAGEFCDPAGPNRLEAACGGDFPCNPVTCSCACPATVHFSGDATSPKTLLDTGWTGIAHRTPVVTNGDITVALSGCTGAQRPCGTCNLTGPLPNTEPTDIRNQRCTNDTSIQCTSNAACIGGGGTCEFFFGTNLPLAAGGVTTCAVNQFNGPISGTANVESGESATTVLVTSRVYNGIAIDNPCPRCIGDATINDNVQGGTCSGGPRNGLACDGNGTVPGRPDFGTTSLDCPPLVGALIAALPINLSSATDPVTKTLTASSPPCSGEAGERCLCDTCNNGAQEPCDDNADCPDPAGPIGPICGGRRCIGGTNAGAACTTNSECAGGGICNRPGEPTKPSACLDNTTTVNVLDCTDTAPVDGEGECTMGPITTTCSVASGHGQRGCLGNGDCGGAAGSCEAASRACLLTGGFTGKLGTNTLVANGVEDPPTRDTSSPTLGTVFCIGPTGSSSVNNVAGLPGPGRLTLTGLAVGHP
jgi:hypothetical protein